MCCAAEKADWETDHNGKMVSIPRPVAALRVWDSSQHEYRGVMTLLIANAVTNAVLSYLQRWIPACREHLTTKTFRPGRHTGQPSYKS